VACKSKKTHRALSQFLFGVLDEHSNFELRILDNQLVFYEEKQPPADAYPKLIKSQARSAEICPALLPLIHVESAISLDSTIEYSMNFFSILLCFFVSRELKG
jgi:hypothetical protein